MKGFFKKLDSAFYFPLGLMFTVLPLAVFYGLITAYLAVALLALLHLCLLKIYPYLRDSSYYQFLAAKNSFFEKHKRISDPFSFLQLLVAKLVLFATFFSSLNDSSWFPALVPCCFAGSAVLLSHFTIAIINISHRPRLPKEVKSILPLYMFKRYNPIVEVVLNKVVPMCAQTLGYVGTFYGGTALAFKGLYGVDTIDPIRNNVLNRLYTFPLNHEWNEMTLSTWKRFCMACYKVDPSINYNIVVNTFITNEDQLTVDYASFVKKHYLDKKN